MRRLVLPVLIPILVVLGLFASPTIAASINPLSDALGLSESPSMAPLLEESTTITNACGCQPRALDVYYIVDLSSSMGQLYPGGGNKLDAAKRVISETNNLIASWDNGSRVGLMTYYGGQNGVGNPQTYEVVTTNQLAFRPFWGGLTDNLTTFNNKLEALSANGSTPTYDALDFSEAEMEQDNGDSIPVFILLSDGVPTISSERHSFNDSAVQGVNIIDPVTGEFRTPQEVRIDGGSGGAPGYYNGEPLADVMEEISAIKQNHPEYIYHALAIQGEGSTTFNPEILQYVADVGGGIFSDSSDYDTMQQSMFEAVNMSACELSILPPDQTYVAEECPFCGNRERQHYAGSINTFSGNYHYRTTDIAVDTFASALYFERSYNSLPVAGDVIYSEPLGYGWTHNYNVRLVFPDDVAGEQNTIIMQAARGSRMRFIEQADGSYEPYAGVWADLVAENSGYAVTAANQERFIFNSSGQLTAYFDPQGNERTFSYTAGKLSRVTEPVSGRWLDLAYNAEGNLQTLSDHLGRQVEYGYQNDNLVVVTDTRGLAWTYSYTGTHKLHQIGDPDGRILEQIFYDSEGRATKQTDGVGSNLVEIDYASSTTRVITASGSVISGTYNLQNLLVSEVDAEGNKHRYGYDKYFNRALTVDANNNQSCQMQSQFGLPLLTIDAMGNISSYAYDEHNNLTAMTDTQGYTSYYAYDSQNNLQAMTDTLGNVTTYSYSSLGQLSSETDALSHSTQYGYNDYGERTVITNALGNTTFFAYDQLGRVITTTNANNQVTVNEYDDAGNVKKTITNYVPEQNPTRSSLPQSNAQTNLTTEYAYDGFGRQIAITDTLGQVTRQEYDDAGRLIKTIQNYTTTTTAPANEYNLVTSYGYDDFGRQVKVTDTLGYLSVTEYDEVGRLKRTITNYQDGIYDENFPDLDLITRFEYDANGNLLSLWDISGAETRTEYDSLNRVARTIVNYEDGYYDPQAADRDLIVSYQYDAAGNQIAITDTAGRATRSDYDALGRVITTIDPLSGTTHYEYDAVGNQIVMTDANGHAMTYAYDELNRTQVVTDSLGYASRYQYDALGNQTVITNARGITVSYGYDSLNRLVMLTDALGYTTTHTYDELGRRLRTTDPQGKVTRYEYDSNGRVLQVTRNRVYGGPIDEQTNVSTNYSYDAAGRRTTVTDAAGHLTRYAYDALGRTLVVTDALTQSTHFVYDGLGNRLSVTNGEGETTLYGYDKASRLMTVTQPLSLTTLYQYDGAGNRLAMTDSEGIQTRYQYDGLDRLVAVIENYVDGTTNGSQEEDLYTRYAYDHLGNRTVLTNALGYTTTYAYDALNHLISEVDALGNTTEYAYDEVGNRTILTDANGLTTTFIYDPLNRLSTIDYPAPTADVSFTYDALSNHQTMNDGTGTTTYTYDQLYRLTSSTNGSNQTVSYSYDNNGNRTQLSHDGQTVTYSYDDANRLQTVQNESGLYSYDYDAANRLTTLSYPNGVESEYDYDAAGRLVALTHAEGEQTYAHYEYLLDGVGNRLAVTETMLVPASQVANLRAPDTSFVREPAQILAEINAYTEPEEALAGSEEPQEALTEHDKGLVSGHPKEEAQLIAFAPQPSLAHSPPSAPKSQPTTELSHHATESTDTISQSLEARLWLPLVTNGEDPFLSMIMGKEPLDPLKLVPPAWLEAVAEEIRTPQQTSPDWTANGSQMNAFFGWSVNHAGDVNGDGYADVIIGSSHYDNGQTDSGAAFVFHGSANGLSTTPDWSAEGSQAYAHFGFSVNSAGDVNGDGYSDVVVGARDYDASGLSNSGRVSVYHGSASGLSTTPAWTQEGAQSNAQFGMAVGTAGDVNADGYDDLFIGAPGYDNDQSNEGRLLLYHGSASGLSSTANWSTEGNQNNANLAFSANSAGDVNGDGYSDLIVGSHTSSGDQMYEGRALVYHGSASGLSTSADWIGEGNQNFALAGYSVASAGDVNRDGYSDVIVGAILYDDDQMNEGAAFVYHGSASGLSPTVNWTGYGNEAISYFGHDVGTAGDVNGDGFSDVIIASPYWAGNNAGRAQLYHGGQNGLTLASWQHEGTQAYAYSGWSTSSAGDINADGYSDILVSSPYYDTNQSNDGQVAAYLGAADIIRQTRTIQYTYDPLYRLLDANYSTGEGFAYQYDAVGNRLTMTDTSGTNTYSYDAANRLEDVTGTSYTYDANGNLLNDGSLTYTYDAANRLVSTTDGTTNSSYQYDGLGNRLAQTTDGTTTEYVLDIAGGLPEVIAATTNGNTTHYLQVGGQLLAQQQAGTWAVILPDHLGSVRQVVDANGNITLAQSYTPFGDVMESTGSVESAFGFTGEQSDQTGLLFLRARYYAPGVGRFTQQDPSRLEANLYAYAQSNPIRFVDPTGFCAQNGDEACWAVYEQLIRSYPELEHTQHLLGDGQSLLLHELSENRLRQMLFVLNHGSNSSSSDAAWLAWYTTGEFSTGFSYQWSYNNFGWASEDLANQLDAQPFESAPRTIGRVTSDIFSTCQGIFEIGQGIATIGGSGALCAVGAAPTFGGACVVAGGTALAGAGMVAHGATTTGVAVGQLGQDTGNLISMISAGQGGGKKYHYRSGKPYNKKELKAKGARRIRRDERKIKSLDFKDFIRGQGKSFRYNEWRKIMETWELPNGRRVENHYWWNKKTGETWHH